MRLKFLKHTKLPFLEKNVIWSICPYTGSLLRDRNEKVKTNFIPKKVSEALQYCENPFLCKQNSLEAEEYYNDKKLNKLNKLHNNLLKISNNRFLATRLYSSMNVDLFDTTELAIQYINKLELQKQNWHFLCLQRAFLTAKTSKQFSEKGVIFIGAFLPTGDMHCWIIEDGLQPDSNDRGWINYRPLIAFHN